MILAHLTVMIGLRFEQKKGWIEIFWHLCLSNSSTYWFGQLGEKSIYALRYSKLHFFIQLKPVHQIIEHKATNVCTKVCKETALFPQRSCPGHPLFMHVSNTFHISHQIDLLSFHLHFHIQHHSNKTKATTLKSEKVCASRGCNMLRC